MTDVHTAGTFRPMVALAAPVLAEQSLTLMVGYTDWWLTGHFLQGPQYQAAMGLMGYLLWLLPSMFAAVAIGATALVARFTGGRKPRLANATLHQALLVGGVMTVVVAFVVLFFGAHFIRLLQLPQPAFPLAVRYLTIITPVIPAIMIQQVAAASLRGAGDTVSGMAAQMVVNIINISLSAALVTGWGPFPNLGWTGLAIGTATGHGVGGLLLLARLTMVAYLLQRFAPQARRRQGSLQLRRKLFRPNSDLIRRLLRIGLPGGLDVLTVLACHLTYLSIINSLGVMAAAAHGLGVQIEALAYLPGIAFQVAAATMAGQYLGAKQPARASRSVWMACGAALSIMTAAGMCFFFGGGFFIAFFTTGDDPVGPQTVQLMKIVALSMPSLALTMVLTGALRGAGDTAWPLAFTLIGFLGVRIPGACLLAWSEAPIPFTDLTLPGFDLGVYGAWWAMVADTLLRSVLVTARFLQGGWKKMRV